MGLLGVIRMQDPDLTTLALGTDLTGLGLHLNSPENVYSTFASPWAEQPLKAEPEFLVSSHCLYASLCMGLRVRILRRFSKSQAELLLAGTLFCQHRLDMQTLHI